MSHRYSIVASFSLLSAQSSGTRQTDSSSFTHQSSFSAISSRPCGTLGSCLTVEPILSLRPGVAWCSRESLNNYINELLNYFKDIAHWPYIMNKSFKCFTSLLMNETPFLKLDAPFSDNELWWKCDWPSKEYLFSILKKLHSRQCMQNVQNTLICQRYSVILYNESFHYFTLSFHSWK